MFLLLVSATAFTMRQAKDGGQLRPITGGWGKIDVNSGSTIEMASFAIATVSKAMNSAKPLTLVRIVSAERQVVAGFNYKMQLELKEGTKNSFKCDVIVLDQGWTNTRKVTQCSCCGSSWKSVDNRPVVTTIAPSAKPTTKAARHTTTKAQRKTTATTQKFEIITESENQQFDESESDGKLRPRRMAKNDKGNLINSMHFKIIQNKTKLIFVNYE